MTEHSGERKRALAVNTPIYSLMGLGIFIVAMVIVYVTDHSNDAGVLFALAASTIPSLVASLSAERASRDIRNGTVTEKVRQGTVAAIHETGVMTRTGPVATAQLTALERQTAALGSILTDVHSLAAQSASTLEQIATDAQGDRDKLHGADGEH